MTGPERPFGSAGAQDPNVGKGDIGSVRLWRAPCCLRGKTHIHCRRAAHRAYVGQLPVARSARPSGLRHVLRGLARRLSQRRFVDGDEPVAERLTQVTALPRCGTSGGRERRKMGRVRVYTTTLWAAHAISSSSAARVLAPKELQEAWPAAGWIENHLRLIH